MFLFAQFVTAVVAAEVSVGEGRGGGGGGLTYSILIFLFYHIPFLQRDYIAYKKSFQMFS